MEIKSERINNAYSIKITAEENRKIVGWVYLYIFSNDLHKEPIGMIENLFIDEKFRRAGIGSKLISALIEKSKELGCYKIVGTSRHENKKVHEFYRKLGFLERGLEFRMDLIDTPSEQICPL